MGNAIVTRLGYSGPIGRLGKWLAIQFSRLFQPTLDPILFHTETYFAALRGKGAGTGWDLSSEVKNAARCIHRKGSVVFDIGANKGEWAEGFLKETRYECVLFLFEPSSYCNAVLQSLHLPQTTLINAAVGEKNETLTLYEWEQGSGLNSLYQRKDSFILGEIRNRTEVPVVTIDKIMKEHDIREVDFMKIDVEGHEFAVLLGAQKALEEQRIKAIAFEFGAANVNSRVFFRDFWDLLHNDFEICRMCPAQKLIPITRYTEELEYFRGVSNYLAVLKSGR